MSDRIPDDLKHKEIIKCIPVGKYIGNHKCHCNTLSYALRHRDKVNCIVGVGQVFSGGGMVAHFILKLNDGTYYDPTYGNLSNILYDYCIPIEEYRVDEFNPNRELVNLQDYFYKLNSFLYRLFNRNRY